PSAPISTLFPYTTLFRSCLSQRLAKQSLLWAVRLERELLRQRYELRYRRKYLWRGQTFKLPILIGQFAECGNCRSNEISKVQCPFSAGSTAIAMDVFPYEYQRNPPQPRPQQKPAQSLCNDVLSP